MQLNTEHLKFGLIWIVKKQFSWAMVVPQLVEWLLPTPEVHGSNPAICKLYTYYCQPCLKDENKVKETWNGPFFKLKPSKNKSNISKFKFIRSIKM